jgi:HEPN domain-containing protein
MDRAEELRQWFNIPSRDLRSAEYLATMRHPTPDELICNLCQQSAEKYLKAFLFLNKIDPPKIHDLMPLLKACEEIKSDFSILMPKCASLTKYGVLPRYPHELQITSDDVKLALRYAKDIKEFVLSVCACNGALYQILED